MPVVFVDRYSRALIKANPDKLFVFGDNMIQSGLKGQAAEARGEPNTVGIPTKWLPSRSDEAYFMDSHWESVSPKIINAFAYIRAELAKGKTVVFPSAPLGSGLAQLDSRAPKLYKKLNLTVTNLTDKFGTSEPETLTQP